MCDKKKFLIQWAVFFIFTVSNEVRTVSSVIKSGWRIIMVYSTNSFMSSLLAAGFLCNKKSNGLNSEDI